MHGMIDGRIIRLRFKGAIAKPIQMEVHALRRRTLILGILFVLLLGFVIYFFVGGTLSAEVRTVTANASEYPEAFLSIRNVLESGAAPQTFSAEALGDASMYTLVDTTITLSNAGLFSAEWLDVQTTGINGDVAVYSLTGEGESIDPRSSGQLNLKIITTADANAVRTFQIQYYVFGMKRTLTVS